MGLLLVQSDSSLNIGQFRGHFQDPCHCWYAALWRKGAAGKKLEEDAEGSICSWRLVRSEKGLFA